MFTPVRNRNKIRTTASVSGRYVVARERAQRYAEEIERDRAYTAGGFVDVTHLPYDLKDRD